MAENVAKRASSRPGRKTLRTALLLTLTVIIVAMALFRYVEERRAEAFRQTAEEEYRRFLKEASVLSGGEGGALAINLSRAEGFIPRGGLGVEVTITVYGGGEAHLRWGSLTGHYEYLRETRLLLYDSGEYLPAILKFRARGDAP